MSVSAVSPASRTSAEILQHSQKAPQFLAASAPSSTPKFLALFSATECSEQWRSYEQLLTSCLMTGDDQSAHLCLERLVLRFGASNERIMGLRGLYQEAVAKDTQDLERVLDEYEEILSANPANIPIAKRRAALFKSLSRTGDAIKALVELLDMSPTDAEAWAELSDLYTSTGMFSQAVYCLEEVLLILPNAWNVHARIGEVLYMSSSESGVSNGDVDKSLNEAIARYCRSIELCDGYLRGYYGLKLATDKLLTLQDGSRSSTRSSSMSREDVQELNRRSTSQLSNIVKANAASSEKPEIIAAKALLDKVPEKK